MLTKTLKFDQNVLNVLRNMEWNEDGTQGIIRQQLDRSMYVAVNKALEAMGGKWNRGKKCHVFSMDPRPSVEGLIESGELEVARDGFFETPKAVIHMMIDEVGRNDEIGDFLEPSAGKGAILKELLEYASFKPDSILLVEQNEDRMNHILDTVHEHFDYIVGDFMEEFLGNDVFDTILMNPPFENGQDIDHVRKAYSHLNKDQGVLVAIMSEGPFFREDKKSKQFRAWLDMVGGRSRRLPADSFKESGTGVNTRMVTIWK